MTKVLEEKTKSEKAWREIFAWARGLYPSAPPPRTQAHLNAKQGELLAAPESQWDRIIKEGPRSDTPAPRKVAGLNERGEPVLSEEFKNEYCSDIVQAAVEHEKSHVDFYYGYSPEHFLSILMESRLLRLRAESEVVSYRTESEILRQKLAELKSRYPKHPDCRQPRRAYTSRIPRPGIHNAPPRWNDIK